MIIILIKINRGNAVYVKSKVDKEEYLVQDKKDKEKAADILAEIKKRIIKLKEYLEKNKEKYEEYKEYIKQLSERIIYTEISESSGDSSYTSYSVNKGEEIVFCIRSRKEERFHEINLLMYVALHEIAHVACPEYGHTDLFKKIFKFFIKKGEEIGIYRKIEFKKEPREYCGLTITESII